MSERKGASIQGRQIGGSIAFETDGSHIEYAPRTHHVYVCAEGHTTGAVFHAEATPPGTWTCRVCRRDAEHEDEQYRTPTVEPVTTGKTHWEQLISRRTEAELEALLAEARKNLRKTGKAF